MINKYLEEMGQYQFLPRDDTRPAVTGMPQYWQLGKSTLYDRLSDSPTVSVCDVQVPRSHRSEYFKNNFILRLNNLSYLTPRIDLNIDDLIDLKGIPP